MIVIYNTLLKFLIDKDETKVYSFFRVLSRMWLVKRGNHSHRIQSKILICTKLKNKNVCCTNCRFHYIACAVGDQLS